MKLINFFLFIIISSFIYCSDYSTVLIKNGTLDISKLNLKTSKVIKLDGTWEFYGSAFISYDKFHEFEYKPLFKSVPDYWHSNGQSNYGYATYRLKLSGLVPFKAYEIFVLPMEDSYTLYFNSEKIVSAGRIGKDSKSCTPLFKSSHSIFVPKTDRGELILHVSGIHGRRAGPTGSILFSEYPSITSNREAKIIEFFFITGAVFFIGLYYLFFYLFRKSEKSALYFSIFCILIAVRSAIVSLDYSFFREIASYEILNKVEYLMFTFTAMFFIFFINAVFHSLINMKFFKPLIYISSVYSVLILITNIKVYGFFLVFYQIIVVISAIILFIMLLSAAKKLRSAAIAAAGFMAIILTLINDILYSNLIINSTNLVTYGVFLFIFLYSTIISSNFANAFSKIELLSSTLRDKNRELEEKNRHIIELMNDEIVQNELRLKNVTHNIPLMIVVFDEEYNIIFWNKEAESITGYSKDEIQSYSVFVEKVITDVNFIMKIETREEFEKYQCEILSKTGEKKVVSFTNMSNCSIRNWNYWIVGTNITDTKKAEYLLKTSEEKYRFLYEENSSVHIVISSDLIIKDVNKQTLRLLGYEIEEIIEKDITFLVSPQQREFLKNIIENMFIGISDTDFEITFISKSNQALIVLFSPSTIVINDENGDFCVLISGTDITKRKEMEKQIFNFATFDIMTDTYNRRAGLEIISNCMKNAKRNKTELSICFIDVDGLKTINDSLGHKEGDLLITRVASIIREHIRESDILVRLGGDEFLLCLPDCSEENADKVWKKITAQFDSENSLSINSFKLSASHGIIPFHPEFSCSVDELVEKADKKMYAEKISRKIQR